MRTLDVIRGWWDGDYRGLRRPCQLLHSWGEKRKEFVSREIYGEYYNAWRDVGVCSQRYIYCDIFILHIIVSTKKHPNQPLFITLQRKFKQIFRIIGFFHKIVTTLPIDIQYDTICTHTMSADLMMRTFSF